MESHSILGGKVQVYRRPASSFWQCAASVAGRQHRSSTKEDSLALAKEVAEDWYLELRGKHRRGEIENRKPKENTLEIAALKFLEECAVITQGQRGPNFVADHRRRFNVNLNPILGSLGLSEITAGKIQEYRIARHHQSMEKWGRPPARNTIHQEIVTLRQILKTAIRHGWLQHLPDMSEPYGSSGKISHRAWFSHEEYKKLYQATARRAKEPLHKNYKWASEQVHDFVLFMANTGVRPDEAYRLQYRDVSIVHDDVHDETILEIEVRGKRGVGFCKSMPGAVLPFQRLTKRNKPKPTDLIFPNRHRELFNAILDEEELKFDREGNRRTAYSLRHTYICFRLMEGADIYQIAKNCRTSVEMIEK